jgi:hypothetical protein
VARCSSARQILRRFSSCFDAGKDLVLSRVATSPAAHDTPQNGTGGLRRKLLVRVGDPVGEGNAQNEQGISPAEF